MIPTMPPTAPLDETDSRAIAPDDITMAASAATTAGRPATWPDRHVYLKVFLFSLALNLKKGQHRLILQTSEGPAGTVPKLQVAAKPIGVYKSTAAAALPTPHPRKC